MPTSSVRCAAQIAQMHEVEGRVQGIVREYAQKSLSYLRPVEVARGLVAEAPYVLDIVHIGAHLGVRLLESRHRLRLQPSGLLLLHAEERERVDTSACWGSMLLWSQEPMGGRAA